MDTITVPLSGGTLTITIDVDLDMSVDDFAFVKRVADTARNYHPEPDTPDELVEFVRTVDAGPVVAITDTLVRRVRGAGKRALAPVPAQPKPVTTSAPRRRARPDGTTSTVPNMTEVAAMIEVLRADGTPIAAGLAKFYNVPATTTRNWIAKCKANQLLAAQPPANLTVIEDNTGPDGEPVTYAGIQVANVYRAALTIPGCRPIQHVADMFNIDRLTAIAYVDRARADGHLPPRNEPQLPDEERADLLAHVPQRLTREGA